MRRRRLMPTRRRLRPRAALAAAVFAAAAPAIAVSHADGPSALTELVDAAAQRLQVAEPVAAFKWSTHGAIEDPARVRQQLADLGDAADDVHLERDYVTRIFGDQISATTAIEYRRFADWTLNPSAAPGSFPDLAASRRSIDGFNQTMLQQLAAHRDVLGSPPCGAQLDKAKAAVTQTRGLDDLYRQALALATRAYCQQ